LNSSSRIEHYNARTRGIDTVEKAIIGELSPIEKFLVNSNEVMDVRNKVRQCT